MIIELIGAPGIGKTTVLHEVLRTGSRRHGVRVSSAATFALQPRLPGLFRWAKGLGKSHALRAHPVSSSLLFRPLRNEERLAAMAEMAPRWEPFLDECLEGRIGGARAPGLRLLAMQWFLETLQLRAWIALHARESDVVFMDEPLSYRLSLFDPTPAGLERARRYGERMPLPDGAVHFIAEAHVIRERLENRRVSRGWINHRHEGLSRADLAADTEWALTVGRLSASILAERGVPVLSLNAERPVHALAGEVRRFVLQVRQRQGITA